MRDRKFKELMKEQNFSFLLCVNHFNLEFN